MEEFLVVLLLISGGLTEAGLCKFSTTFGEVKAENGLRPLRSSKNLENSLATFAGSFRGKILSGISKVGAITSY